MLFNTNNSIKYQSSAYTQLNDQTVLLRTIQFSHSTKLNGYKYCYVSLRIQLNTSHLLTSLAMVYLPSLFILWLREMSEPQVTINLLQTIFICSSSKTFALFSQVFESTKLYSCCVMNAINHFDVVKKCRI